MPKIAIWQIDPDRDDERLMFLGLESRKMLAAEKERIDLSIYDKVWEGVIDCKSLEEVYEIFNVDPPQGYKARSLSVSDVVEVEWDGIIRKGFYFCNNIGFQRMEVIGNVPRENLAPPQRAVGDGERDHDAGR